MTTIAELDAQDIMAQEQRKAVAKSKMLALCELWKTRVNTQNYKGRTADKMAVEFFVGAYMMATVSGDKEMETAASVLAWMIAIRGAAYVAEYVSNASRKNNADETEHGATDATRRTDNRTRLSAGFAASRRSNRWRN